MCPGVRLVIDIGGQDSKAITVDEDGLVEEFAMNDRCASGTGRFFEVLARALECELDELPAWRCSGHHRPRSQQHVRHVRGDRDRFAARPGPAAGRHRCLGPPGRRGAYAGAGGAGRQRTPVVLTGGVARNTAAVRFLAEALHLDVQVPAHPQITGAYGAALLAAESAGRAPDPGRTPDQADADMSVPLFPGPLFPGPLCRAARVRPVLHRLRRHHRLYGWRLGGRARASHNGQARIAAWSWWGVNKLSMPCRRWACRSRRAGSRRRRRWVRRRRRRGWRRSRQPAIARSAVGQSSRP